MPPITIVPPYIPPKAPRKAKTKPIRKEKTK